MMMSKDDRRTAALMVNSVLVKSILFKERSRLSYALSSFSPTLHQSLPIECQNSVFVICTTRLYRSSRMSSRKKPCPNQSITKPKASQIWFETTTKTRMKRTRLIPQPSGAREMVESEGVAEERCYLDLKFGRRYGIQRFSRNWFYRLSFML